MKLSSFIIDKLMIVPKDAKYKVHFT